MFALPSIFMLYYAKEGDGAMPRQPNPHRPYWAAAISEARLKAGLTQEELAERIHKPLATIKTYERGSRVPPFDVLYAIADVTGEDVCDLISLDLRHGGSTGFSQFIDVPFAKALGYINDDHIRIDDLFDSGYTNDDVEIVNTKTGKSKIYSKMALLLEIANIKNELKKQYEAELRKSVTKHVNDLLK